MTHQQTREYSNPYPLRKNIAYISIPMNLQNGYNIKQDIIALFAKNNWETDWWLDNTSYESAGMLRADAIVFVLPVKATSMNKVGFKADIKSLTRGIASEIALAEDKNKKYYIAYYDYSGAVGIYNARIDPYGITGTAGTRDVIFQGDDNHSPFPLTKLEELEAKARTKEKKFAELKNTYGAQPDTGFLYKKQAITVGTGETALGAFEMVKSRGIRKGRLKFSFVSVDLSAILSKTNLEYLQTIGIFFTSDSGAREEKLIKVDRRLLFKK